MKFEELNLIERSETKEMAVEDLKLDSDNVRLQHIKQHLKVEKMKDKEIEDYFWAEPATKELYNQILAAKGLYQEIIIDWKNVVKEGNRREVCLRRLKKEANEGKLLGIPKNQFDKVKCIVLPRDSTDAEISLLLGTIHVKGKKAWIPYDKAKHITHLHNDLNYSYDSLSKILAMGKITLMRMVDAYEATKNYGESYPNETDWFEKYTYFDELYKRKSLKEWRKDPKHITLFSQWVHEKKFHDVRDVRFLDKVLQDEDAMKMLDRKKFKDALEIIYLKDPSIQDSNFRKIKDTLEAIRTFSRKDIIQIMNDNSRKNMLEKLMNEVRILLDDIEAIERSSKKRKEEI